MAKKKSNNRRGRQQSHAPSEPVSATSAKTPWGLYALVFAIAIGIGFVASRPGGTPAPASGTSTAPEAGDSTPNRPTAVEIHADYAGSASCRDCHADQFNEWKGSHHGLAERLVSTELDKEAFVPSRTIKHATQTSEARGDAGGFEFVTMGLRNKQEAFKPERAIGVSPLLQYLVDGGNGRSQAIEIAWDPHKKEWFDVYGDEDRRPGEWGHWTGRGMNWNAMCASCHNTRLLKNYDQKNDRYDTKMAEIGVGCESCHGGMKAHVDWQKEYADKPGQSANDPHLKRFTRDQHIDNCGPCHARRTELTGDFVPGESFFDHYSLVIPDETDIFYPDGQVRDEDYEFTSFLSSRMHAAGVRCFDCHNPHSAKTRLPGNQLCLTCHNGQNPELPNIPRIDPIAHSHHKSETEPGGRCVDCHMPLTTYMQRHPRRDHGFTIPDPLLTKQHGIPNACNRCHEDKDADWSLGHVDNWYGDRMNRPTRQRAQWVSMARTNAPGSHINLITLARTETNFLWRAVAAGLMRNHLHETSVREELLKRLTDQHPLVRGTAMLSLEPAARQPGTREHTAALALLKDPSRKVRIDAAWVLRSVVDTNTTAGSELLQYFAQTSDQPAGQMQQGVFHFDRQRPDLAAEHFRKAGSWDTNTAAPHHELAVALSVQGQALEAVEQLRLACKIDPDQVEFRYKLALGLHELNDLEGARRELEAAVRIDPGHPGAWYNLALALDQLGRPNEAVAAMDSAAKADHLNPRIPYAKATILMKLQRVDEAREALRQTLTLDANHGPARALWQQLGGAN
ncbi:MAG: tetratricopeptide repeat protein [Verrucomicrobiae bacterium]|nr:tetratricopeptide repeat protein [Verrucomicrobiae bacterium]